MKRQASTLTCRSLSAMACAWHSASASVALRSSALNSDACAQCASQGSRESEKTYRVFTLQGMRQPGRTCAQSPMGSSSASSARSALPLSWNTWSESMK